MSSVAKVKPEIQRIYTEGYRFIRQHRNQHSHIVPPTKLALSAATWKAFMFALISHDNKHVKLTGWHNPMRERLFWTVQFDRYPELHIPF